MVKKILIVDDEADMAEMLSEQLQSRGYETLLAYDGQEGLARAKEALPDLIILDEMMPKMGGFKVCALLKADSRFKGIPVIMFTARDQSDMSDQLSKDVGFDGYAAKTIDFDELARKIENLLNAGEENS